RTAAGSLAEGHDVHQRPAGTAPGRRWYLSGRRSRRTARSGLAGQHALLVGSRTGAVPAWVRLQPPPHRTAQTDFPYAALLSASRHGLCDLSTRSAFGRSPIADSVVSEEPEPFMEPHRTPPLPAEAAIRLVSLRHDVDPPPQVLQTNGRRNHAAPASHVVGGSAEQQGPFAP